LLVRNQRGPRADWARMPMVVFNEKDQLQDVVLAARGVPRPPVVHRVPSTADFLAAVRAGLGWGLVPEHQLAPELSRGDLVRMPGATPVDVDLFWQRWRLQIAALDSLTSDVRSVAGSGLRRPRS
jgi:LysR family transcriptional regulator, chromosome initiation inhibitor